MKNPYCVKVFSVLLFFFNFKMMKTRYSLIVANRNTGDTSRLTVQVWPIVTILSLMLALPIAWFLSARWATQSEIENLRLKNARLGD